MADDAAAADEVAITFNVKSSNDAKYTITIPLSNTVLQLKEKLSGKEFADLPPERQRLIYSGRVLKDADTLSSYKIKENNTVHLVKGAASNQRQNPANQGTSSGEPATGVPQNLAAGPGANNLLAGLTGARFAGHANLPDANMFGPDGGMGPPPDPEQIMTMLENPAFASTLNEALSNPQVVESMIQQNPMLRSMGPEMRQMLQNPEFRRHLTDPQLMRRSLEMQRMFGGGPFGGQGGGGSSFPAPGATDTTPAGTQGGADNQQGQQPPPNPFAMLGGQGASAQNPFAALFGATPTTSPPPSTSTGQTPGNEPSTPSGAEATQQPGQQQQAPNPFAQLANNPFFQNPELMRQMFGAANVNAGEQGGNNGNGSSTDPSQQGQQQNPLAALMQAMGGAGAGAGGLGGGGAFNPWAFGGGSPPPQNPPDTRPPEERYAEQLRQLNDMGFYEFERNVEALRRTGGSVQGAVEYLLTH